MCIRDRSCEEVDDLLIPDQGIEIDKIQKTAEGIRTVSYTHLDVYKRQYYSSAYT